MVVLASSSYLTYNLIVKMVVLASSSYRTYNLIIKMVALLVKSNENLKDNLFLTFAINESFPTTGPLYILSYT